MEEPIIRALIQAGFWKPFDYLMRALQASTCRYSDVGPPARRRGEGKGFFSPLESFNIAAGSSLSGIALQVALQKHFKAKRDHVLKRLEKLGLIVDIPPVSTFYIWLNLENLPPPLNNGLVRP